MRVAVFGLGYVGCITAACLAEQGHDVVCVDPSRRRVNSINAGRAPVTEPGLGKLVRSVVQSHNLRAASELKDLGEVSVVCGGPVRSGSGSPGLASLRRVVARIGYLLRKCSSFHVVAIRSTVFPGAVEGEVVPLLARLSGKVAGEDFGVCVVPELMRESIFLEDLLYPPFTLIGASDRASADRVASLFATLGPPIERATAPVAEMVKHVSNAFHCLKVCFANEVVSLSRAMGINGRSVMEILCKDTRQSMPYRCRKPGPAFAGACLPDDLGATLHKARQLGAELPILASLLRSNRMQIELALNLVETAGKSRVGVLGISSDGEKENLQTSPAVKLIESLIRRGYKLAIYDEDVAHWMSLEVGNGRARQKLAHIWSRMAPSPRDVVQSSDLIIVAKTCPQIREAVVNEAGGKMVVDLVRLLRRTRQKSPLAAAHNHEPADSTL